jgi:hypothetical protein
MRITLLGAAGGEVTGSAYVVETETASVMVDCGFFQGAKKIENFNRLPKKGALIRPRTALQRLIKDRHGIDAESPALCDVITF